MELLPSGSCCLFTVVPACVHDIAQLGRYLEFLGFISNQNCPQSLVSKDRKIILSGEQWNRWESIPGKALADRAPCPGCSPSLLHLAHGAVGLDPPHYTAPWKKELSWCPQAALALQSAGELMCVLPKSLCPRIPAGRELLWPSVAPLGWLCLQNVWSSHPLSYAHAYIFE